MLSDGSWKHQEYLVLHVLVQGLRLNVSDCGRMPSLIYRLQRMVRNESRTSTSSWTEILGSSASSQDLAVDERVMQHSSGSVTAVLVVGKMGGSVPAGSVPTNAVNLGVERD